MVNKIDNAFMLNATIRNGKLNGELNDDNGELNPALLYLNKSELAVYRTFQSIRHTVIGIFRVVHHTSTANGNENVQHRHHLPVRRHQYVDRIA